MKILNLYEWMVKTEPFDFKNEYQAKQFIIETLNQNKVIHEGDCTKQNFTCSLCVVNQFLEDYYSYCKKEIKKLYE